MNSQQPKTNAERLSAARLPAVSVVIPFCGQVSELAVALLALESQSIRDFEVVVVADGCDVEDQVLSGLRGRAISASVLRLPEQLGTFRARAAGAAAVSGTYLWFLDHDDSVAPEFLEKMLARARDTEADVVECPFIVVPVVGEPYQWRRFNAETVRRGACILECYLVGKSYNNLANKLIRLTLWEIAMDQINVMLPRESPKLIYCEDMLCTMLLYRHAKVYASTIQAEYCYLQNPQSSMQVRDSAIVDDCLNSLEVVLRTLAPVLKAHGKASSLEAFRSREVEWNLEHILGRVDHCLASEGWNLVGRIRQLFS